MTMLIAVAAAGVCIPLVGSAPVDGGIPIPWWVLLLGFIVTEVAVVHLTFGRNSVSFSMSEIPITLSFGAVAPIFAIAIRVLGSAIGLVSQRVRGVKLAFNVASAALETAAATLVYRAVLGDAHPLDPRGWFAVLAAALAVVAGIVFVAYRAWTIQARRYGHMEVLYEFTRALDDEEDIEHLVLLALVQAKRLTGASHAELVLSVPNETSRRWVLAADVDEVTSHVAPESSVWWEAASGDAVCASGEDKDPHVREWLELSLIHI